MKVYREPGETGGRVLAQRIASEAILEIDISLPGVVNGLMEQAIMRAAEKTLNEWATDDDPWNHGKRTQTEPRD